MNKKAEEAGGEAWSKIIKIILVIVVLILVLFALFFGNIPGWLNNLLPDFLKTHTDNSAFKIEQANISEMQKSLDCPSPDRAITLIYKSGRDDKFQVRYNTNLGRAQVYIWPNYNVNSPTISFYNNILGKEKSKKDSKEWLIYVDSDLDGMYDKEVREIKSILDANTKDVFITEIINVVKNDPDLYIDLGSGEESKEIILTKEKIENFLNDSNYQEQYKEDLKAALPKCNDQQVDYLKLVSVEQEKISERLKNLTCPSSYRSIFLIYKSGLDDLFELRFNNDSELNRPQIKMWINFGLDNTLNHISLRNTPQISSNTDIFTKEWLINPDLFESFNKNNEFRLDDKEIKEIRHIMSSATKDEFIERISELSQDNDWDISWNRYYGTGNTKSMTQQEILNGLNDPNYLKQYEGELKKASDKCKPAATTL
jgi:hypothetical protein